MSSHGSVTAFMMVAPIFILAAVAYFWPKWRIALLFLAVTVSTIEVIGLIWEKDNEKQTIVENMDYVNSYLNDNYPGEEWILRRKEGISLKHGAIEVVFLNEPNHVYTYNVERGEVWQSGNHSTEGTRVEMKHAEE
ncbi:hypothetical protein NLX67_15035 [Domibacillus sp. A3M-37]|uniref:hypothetical protein n=1 Tax=Domibacillus sp. A3M-37 TaxID=2962037 RepID=UPI0020B77A64|nr:hypothetical protein [Domibacillus sp. A3M-37]MCP3763689.1 hypothetical protein [Domibacillus sp. A3M-37]